MDTSPLTRHPLDPRFGIRTVLATAIAVIGIVLTVAFIALPIRGSSHGAAKRPIAGGQTLIHFYGTGALPLTRRSPATPVTRTESSETPIMHFYGLQP